jgi:hypothetical protein
MWHACTHEKRNADKVFVGNLNEKDQIKYLSICERIILQWLLQKWNRRVWTVFIWPSAGTGGGLLLTQ